MEIIQTKQQQHLQEQTTDIYDQSKKCFINKLHIQIQMNAPWNSDQISKKNSYSKKQALLKPPLLRDLSHKKLYNLLQKALFGLIVNGQNLIVAIQTFFDLDKMAKDQNLDSNPCQCDPLLDKDDVICDCIIGYLLNEQVFVNGGKCEEIYDKQQTSGEVRNLLQGKIALSLGKSVTNNIMNFNVSVKKDQSQMKAKSYYTKKFSYQYGTIILKNNIFQPKYLSKAIIDLKQQLMNERNNVLQNSLSKTSIQKDLLQLFSDQFGDVIATGCDVGVYVATYQQYSLQDQAKSKEIKGGAEFKDAFAISANSRQSEQQNNKKSSSNYIIVKDPTIIKRNNYAATNMIARLYQPSQEQLVEFLLKSQFFLIIVRTSLSQYFVDLNIKESHKWDNNMEFKIIKYNKQKREKNRLYLVNFDQINVQRGQKSRFIVNCNIISRSIKKKCRLQIRSFDNQKSQRIYFELDNITIIEPNQQIYLCFNDTPPRLWFQIFQKMHDFFQNKQNFVTTIPISQNKSFFYLYSFKTRNDKIVKQIQGNDLAKKSVQLNQAKNKLNVPVEQNKQKNSKQKQGVQLK